MFVTSPRPASSLAEHHTVTHLEHPIIFSVPSTPTPPIQARSLPSPPAEGHCTSQAHASSISSIPQPSACPLAKPPMPSTPSSEHPGLPPLSRKPQGRDHLRPWQPALGRAYLPPPSTMRKHHPGAAGLRRENSGEPTYPSAASTSSGIAPRDRPCPLAASFPPSLFISLTVFWAVLIMCMHELICVGVFNVHVYLYLYIVCCVGV